MSYPNGYARYAAIMRSEGLKPDTNAAKFAARFKFAGQLNSIEILGLSQTNNQTYVLVLRISLAYSALEQLESLLGSKNIPLKNERLAKLFRGSNLARFRDFLSAESVVALQKELEKLYTNAGDSNLNPVVRAIRHAMFHGSLNPSRAGLSTKTAQTFLSELDQLIFKVMETEFSNYIGANR